MNGLTKSIQKELNHYFKVFKGGDFDIQHISKSAFTQARAKLKHTAFVDLSDQVVDEFYDAAPWMSWLGHRLLAIDGSTLVLPESASLKEQYGAHRFGAGEREKAIARISNLYDPLNQMIIHASISKFSDSEKSLCEGHLDFIQSGDVVLFDRYYPSVWLFLVLQKIGADFIMRVNEKHWKAAREIIASNKNERVIEFSVSPNHQKMLIKYGVTSTTIKCRLIRTTLRNGDQMVLCTSLLQNETYHKDAIIEAYGKRWGIEENYKFLKCRLDIENFTGKTPHAILQDFYVKILLSNICSLATLEQELILEDENQKADKKHQYRINRTFAISSFKDMVIHIFLKKNLKRALEAFRDIIKKALSPTRKDRSFPRRTSPRKLNKEGYKPI